MAIGRRHSALSRKHRTRTVRMKKWRQIDRVHGTARKNTTRPPRQQPARSDFHPPHKMQEPPFEKDTFLKMLMYNDNIETNIKEPATIVIAGGGIVGLVLAMSIKTQLGITPEVYEKSGNISTEAGAGLGMYPNGLRVLRDISPELLQAVRGAGFPYKTRRWERHDGTEIMNAEESQLSDEDKDLDPIGIRRSKLQMVLLSYAFHMGIKCHLKMPLASAVQRDDGLVEVTFGDKNGTKRLTHVLFGADGAHSKTRLFVAEPGEGVLEYTGVTCLMGLSKNKCDGICFPSSDKDGFHAVFFPTGEEETCFQFHVPVPEKEANQLNWGNMEDGVAAEECKGIANQLRAEGWNEKYIKPLEKPLRAVRVGFALMNPRLSKWVKGRIALVGDSAHPPVPYIGQGAQQGLEDAGVVVSMLKIYCMDEHGQFDPANFEKAMALYQSVRTKRSSEILNFSKSLGKMQADRCGKKVHDTRIQDNLLKGEVLMYGTLPIMLPGAKHDYKDDVYRVTEEVELPKINEEEAMSSLEHLLGFVPPKTPAIKAAPSSVTLGVDYKAPSQRYQNLIDWLVEGLEVHLKRILVHREQTGISYDPSLDEDSVRKTWAVSGHFVVDEVKEIVEVPRYKTEVVLAEQKNPNWVPLQENISEQLREFVMAATTMYRDNPFHNFEHACNVTMSVSKFLTRMSAEKGVTLTLGDRTFGIVSDPLTLFSIIFAAMFHDADHEGVPNTQLMNEHPDMAKKYKNQAIAEQHSIDIAFDILMEPKYFDLRATIYANEEEMRRFRQVVVNVIMATDICDKDLKEFRNKRWAKAFDENTQTEIDSEQYKNLKATIGIETLIQASDIKHTMSNWTVYKKWNERLFAEMYKAFKEGRSGTDPSSFWFKGEIGFFDFYIIPLAKKLMTCEVFGTMSQECLSHAQENREAWLRNGPGAIEEMIRKVTLQISQPTACTA